MIDVDYLCDTLAHQGDVLMHLSTGINDADARHRFHAGSWSVLEVYSHLYDEEREDFRIRVIQTLTAPELPLPDIDPQGWVQTRRYNEQSLAQVCQRFASERQHSIAQLRTLPVVAWTQPLNHPRLHQLTAAQVAWAWVAHDLLHIRQITELRYRIFARQTDAYGYGYAGEWGPD